MADLLHDYLSDFGEDDDDPTSRTPTGSDITTAVEKAIEGEAVIARLQAGEHEAASDLRDIAEGVSECLNRYRIGGSLEAFDRLLSAIADEVEDLMRAGLHDDAAHRVHLITHPKWPSRTDCLQAYDAAIASRSALDAANIACKSLPMFRPPQPEA